MRIAIILVLTLVCHISFSQSTEEQRITDVIEKLFTGMKKGDSTMVRECFVKNPGFASVFRSKNADQTVLRVEDLQEFLVAVGTPHKETWYEEYWNLSIRIDGDFASAWCEYGFYLDNTFSHCGVDAFHLVRQNDGWKIFHLADTRRKLNYDVPENVKQKHISK